MRVDLRAREPAHYSPEGNPRATLISGSDQLNQWLSGGEGEKLYKDLFAVDIDPLPRVTQNGPREANSRLMDSHLGPHGGRIGLFDK